VKRKNVLQRIEKRIFVGDMMQAFLALLIGAGSSLLVLLFKKSIVWIHEGISWISLHLPASSIWGWMIFTPVAGGLLVGAMQHFVLRKERHHGVAAIMEAVALAGGRLPYLQAPAKIVAAAVSLGSGASVGPEDPSVQIGANLGSMVGQVFKMSDQRTRVLVATGAAAGIATAFNAPIAGVFFALELILGEYSTSAFGMMILGSVGAAVVSRSIVGPSPAFPIPAYAYHGPIELPFYFGLGVLAGPVALAYIRMLYFAHDWFHRSPMPTWIRPAIVGVVLGVVSLRFPEILGDGYETVGAILRGYGWAPLWLLSLVAIKLVLTDFSLGAGFVGGVFAPSLFLGVALGSAYGTWIANLFPDIGIQPSAFALVGMAAVLAGAVRAPGTAIMLLFEMTDDYRIFLPLMFAVVVSMAISSWLERDSVYTLSLRRAGIRLQRGRDIDVLESIQVKDVMVPPPATVPDSTPMRLAADLLAHSHFNGVPVVDDANALVGIISIHDIEAAFRKDPKNYGRPVGEFCSRHVVTAYPDETVQRALQRMAMHDIGRLPVVERDHPRHIVGWLSRSAVVNAYKLALANRMKQRHRAEQVRLGAYSGAEVLELKLRGDSPLVGKKMSEIVWPRDSLVVSIQRGTHLMIPHGDTRLQKGDRIAVMIVADSEEAVRRLVDGSSNAAEEESESGEDALPQDSQNETKKD